MESKTQVLDNIPEGGRMGTTSGSVQSERAVEEREGRHLVQGAIGG